MWLGVCPAVRDHAPACQTSSTLTMWCICTPTTQFLRLRQHAISFGHLRAQNAHRRISPHPAPDLLEPSSMASTISSDNNQRSKMANAHARWGRVCVCVPAQYFTDPYNCLERDESQHELCELGRGNNTGGVARAERSRRDVCSWCVAPPQSVQLHLSAQLGNHAWGEAALRRKVARR